MLTLQKSFDESRTAKLVGIKYKPFGIYHDSVSEAMPVGPNIIRTNEGTFMINVLTGIATSIGKTRRLYQVARLV